VSSQGSPRSVFKRAIERGNFTVAEVVAREVGHITLEESLALVVLAVEKAPGRRNRYLLTWLHRLLERDENLTIDEVVLAASALAALGGRGHEQAVEVLEGVAARSNRRA
jgi:hypothetical protein